MNGITLAEFSEKNGIKYDALRKRWKKNFPERKFDSGAVLSASELSALSGKQMKVEKRISSLPAKETAAIIPANIPAKAERKEQAKKPAFKISIDNMRAGATVVVLLLIVLGHAGLIWYDCAIQWGAPGVIGGGMAALIALSASMLTFDRERLATAQTALWLVFFIDAGAWFIHYATFTRTAQIGNMETGVFAGAICAMSFASLYILKEFKLETIWQNG